MCEKEGDRTPEITNKEAKNEEQKLPDSVHTEANSLMRRIAEDISEKVEDAKKITGSEDTEN